MSRFLVEQVKPAKEREDARTYKRAVSLAWAWTDRTGNAHAVFDRQAGQRVLTTEPERKP